MAPASISGAAPDPAPDEARPLTLRGLWRPALALWGGFAVVSYVVVSLGQWVLGEGMLWSGSAYWALRWSLWLACTPVIVALARRFPLLAARGAAGWTRTLGAHLLGSLGLTAGTMLLVFAATAPLFRLEAGLRLGWRSALNWVFTSYDTFLALYLLVVLGYGLLAQLQRSRRLEQAHAAALLHNAALQSQLSEARLLALRMQLNPHFLFNTHQAIVGLILQGDGAAAIEMIAALSELLRAVLTEEPRPLVPLHEEVAIVEKYLAIQQIRFRQKLRVLVDLAPEARPALLPSFLLQPLVENALVHGLEGLSGPARLTLRARVAGGQLLLELHDNGRGASDDTPHRPAGSGGVGLRNTRARLQQQYGPAATLQLKQAPGQGTLVTVALPYEAAPVAPAPIRHPEPALP